jgi:hypothetical protein
MITLIQIGKKFKVYKVDPTKNDGKNKKLLGTFKTSMDAEIFINSIR